jgi:Domain of unknown function (DUF4157)
MERWLRPRDRALWDEGKVDVDEDLEHQRERRRRVAPSKTTRAAESDREHARGAPPGKQSAAGTAEATSPQRALEYSQWLLSPARGWSAPHELRIDRRASGEHDEDRLPEALALVAAAGSGAPLPAALRQQLSLQLGADLSRLRVHTDARAAEAAAALHAQAFTIGHEVYFARGAYDPDSPAGIELIAHEAAHVAQNQHSFSSGGRRVSDPGDAHERSAEDFASRFVRSYRGDAARAAAGLFSAAAAAVRGIVGLAEETPQRDKLLGELDRVIRREPQQAAGSSAPAASTEVVHRAAAAPAWNITDAVKRVAMFVNDTSLVPRRDHKDPKADHVFAMVGDESYFFEETSATRWQRADYVAKIKPKLGAPLPSDEDLEKDLEAVHRARKVPGLVLCAKSWGWIDPKENPPKDVLFVGTLAYEHKSVSERYDGYVTTLHETQHLTPLKKPLSVTFKSNTTVTFSKTQKEKPSTEKDLQRCREAIRVSMLSVGEYQMENEGGWDLFFKDVITGPATKFPAPFQGDLFAALATRDLGHTVSKQEIRFDDKRLDLDEGDRRADGIIEGSTLKLAEFKAYSSAPDLKPDSKLGRQAANYAKIVALGITAKKIDPPAAKGPFTQVAYIFPTKEVSEQWAPGLKEIFDKQGVASALRVFPAAKGSGVATLKVNPTFQVPLQDAKQTVHTIPAPEMLHPGLTFSTLELHTKAPGDTTVESGSVEVATNLGGTLTGEKKSKPIAAGGVIENKLEGLKSSLDKIFKGGRVSAEASLIDGGVQGKITVSEGPSGIPNLNLQTSSLTVTYKGEGQLTVTGAIGLASVDGKIHGTASLGWNGADWTFAGQATVEAGVIKGVEKFTAKIGYDSGKWTLGVDVLTIKQQIKAVTLTGKLLGVRYDVDKGDFSGMAQLEADLGLFGTANAEATIEHNKLTHATFSYNSPLLKYPPKSGKPVIKGTVGGTITYEDGKLSGKIQGSAGISVPALEKLAGEGGLGLAVDGEIHPDGSFSGSIATQSPIKLGKHFEIPSMACKIEEDGSVVGDFRIKVVDFKFLDKTELGLRIDKNGITVKDAAANVKFGSEQDKVHGSIDVAYSDAAGLAVTGSLSVKIKEGMVATGKLAYNSKTGLIDAELKVDEITLLNHGPVKKTLFEFSKQIPLIAVFGLGVYLEIGFDLNFKYQFDLRLAPKVTLDGLDPSDFSYKKVAADIELRGLLSADLEAIPKVGLGLFALSPSLLRGGGGVMIPITGSAKLVPRAKVHLEYDSNGGVNGDAEMDLALTFGIKGSVKPYANISLLDGVWDKEWKGDSLADFEIMPPKELFNFQLNLGGDLKKQEPQIPEKPSAPKAGGGKQLPQEQPATKQEGKATADANATVPTSGPSGSSGGLPDEPVKLDSLLGGLKNLPGYRVIEAIMKKAGAAWDKIKGFFGRVAKAFKSFFDGLASGIEEIIDGFSKEGLAYLPKLIKKFVGPTAWEVIEPLITAVAQNAEKMLQLFESDPPAGLSDFFPWALKLAANAWGIAFNSVGSLVTALGTMLSRVGPVMSKLVTKMVRDGMIGVKRHTYWVGGFNFDKGIHKHYFFAATQYKIHMLGVSIDFYDEGMITDPRSVVGVGLFDMLEQLGVPPLGGYFEEKIGQHSRDRWA